jgi:hypothetical protein
LVADIDNSTNPLPYWSFVKRSGTAITARVVADSAQAQGYRVDFTMAAGAAGDDSYIEQFIPLVSTRGQSFTHYPAFDWGLGTGGVATRAYIECAYFTEAGSIIGSATTGYDTMTSFTPGQVRETGATYNSSGFLQVPPTNAAFLRVRIGLSRSAAANGATEVLSIYGAFIGIGRTIVWLADGLGSTEPGRVGKHNGAVFLNSGTGSGTVEIGDASDVVSVSDLAGDDPSFTLTGEGSATSSGKVATWYQIGKLVYVNFSMTITANGSGGTTVSTSTPSGLPLPTRATGLYGNRSGVGVGALYARLATSGSIDQFRPIASGGTAVITGADLANGATYQVSGWYETT